MGFEYAPRIDNIDKNYLMNGSMDLFQRFLSPAPFSGVSLTTSFAYLNADRWAQTYVAAGMGATPATCSSTTVPNELSKYSLNWIVTPTSTNAEMRMYQRIEAAVASELSSKSISVGLMINSPSASQMVMELWVPQGPDNYTTETMIYTQTVAFATGSWQQVVFENITLPSVINGLEVRFRLTNWTTLSGPYNVYMTQFGLTKTHTSEGFNRFGGTLLSEIQACQRYYEKSYNLDVNPGTATGIGGPTSLSTNVSVVIPFWYKVTKRVLATTQCYSIINGAAAAFYDLSTASNIAAGEYTSGTGQTTFYSSGASGAGNTVTAQFTADAEL